MELPDKYQNLYKHWSQHTRPRVSRLNNKDVDTNILNEIIYLINERIRIFKQKELNKPRPYTSDSILSTYRFCNVYRELDRQTVFYHEYLKPLEGDFDTWLLNMLFCRSICNTDTIQKVGLLSLNEDQNKTVYEKLVNLPSPKYGNAYIFPISLIQKSEWNTREKFYCLYYPSIIKRVADLVKTLKKASGVEALDLILPRFGFNLKFLWTEVLIDIAYQYPDLIDLYKRFPIGPGSRPTMLKINNYEDPEITNVEMIGLLEDKLDLLTINGDKIFLSAENWEGIGCEYRKYSNLKSGKGRRRLYR